MALTLQELYNLRAETGQGSLKQRLVAQIAKSALYIKSAGGIGADNTKYADQTTWANRVLSSLAETEREAEKLMWMILESADIQDDGNACTDQAIQWQLEYRLNNYVPGE